MSHERKILSLILVLVLMSSQGKATEPYASSSVLASGKWYKIAVTRDGIYRIDFSKLKQLGLENPSHPRLFGNNRGQLSYYNDGTAPDDLREIAMFYSTGSDSVFNEGDYLLFYGTGTHRWVRDRLTDSFDFLRHNYSDTAFYFITSGPSPGKKVTSCAPPSGPATNSSTSYDINFIYEHETENLIGSGREWYEPVTWLRETAIDPGLKDILISEPVKYSLRVLARSESATSFVLSQNGIPVTSVSIGPTNTSSTTGAFAQTGKTDGELMASSSSPVYSLRFENNGYPAAKAWIDYLKLQCRRQSVFDGQLMQFADSRTVGPGIVTEFTIKSSAGGVMIWDVTDQDKPAVVQTVGSGQSISFRAATDTLRTFVVFTPENFIVPSIRSTALKNQDLHGSGPADMIIITHPLFLDYARELSDYHQADSGINSFVATTEQIYNEFSGGVPDIAALRNFVRMKFLRQKGSSHPLRYLLLFGDGSFENKTSPPGNPNFVPTYQTQNSSVYVSSFTSDDFFGLLEDGEGEVTGTEDIGIGRLPVSDTSEAAMVLSKIKRYLSPENHGDWKNVVCLVADDEDANTHMRDAEGLAGMIADSARWINTVKIYFDAFRQETSSVGQFYPGVNEAINSRVTEGALILNYIGHGNETGLGHERVLTSTDIDKWRNGSRLPLFITATCEFSRFDDVNINPVTGDITEKSSAGEKILLASEGGGIALMSTTRLAYSAPNYSLNKNIIDAALDFGSDGKAPYLGDIIRIAKNRSGSNINKRNFVLLGDPAVRLSWPWYGTVATDSINNAPAGELTDTLKALSLVTVTGHLEDNQGREWNEINGTVEAVVYAQPAEVETLANDGGEKMTFSCLNNILFKGQTVAVNGRFKFSFIVPREIDHTFGKGRIVYYAWDVAQDFRGSFADIIVGGFTDVVSSDTTGPEIRIFMNDTLFRDGGMTDGDPRLLAVIRDAGGINVTGAGIGHDLTCWLDNDRSTSVALNLFFENVPGSFTSGTVSYPFNGISPGWHILTLKAWDNYNNSSEKSLRFYVEGNRSFTISKLINYPNPFKDKTAITAEHNMPGREIEVTVEIFSMSGEKIRVIKTFSTSSGYVINPVTWDGTNGNNKKVAGGIYPYRMILRISTGETASISGRFIIY